MLIHGTYAVFDLLYCSKEQLLRLVLCRESTNEESMALNMNEPGDVEGRLDGDSGGLAVNEACLVSIRRILSKSHPSPPCPHRLV